jgi:hypothetical protein
VSTPLDAPRALDLLERALLFVRPRLARKTPTTERLKILWAACVAARNLATNDVIEKSFLALAAVSGITDDLGRHAEADLRHVIRMAIVGQNPFQ